MVYIFVLISDICFYAKGLFFIRRLDIENISITVCWVILTLFGSCGGTAKAVLGNQLDIGLLDSIRVIGLS